MILHLSFLTKFHCTFVRLSCKQVLNQEACSNVLNHTYYQSGNRSIGHARKPRIDYVMLLIYTCIYHAAIHCSLRPL